MTLTRRGVLRMAGATGASLLLPKVAQTVQQTVHDDRRIKPAYILTGGATTSGILVHSVLSHNNTYEYVDLAVSTDKSMSGYRLIGAQRADGDAIVRHEVTGCEPNTTYFAKLVSKGLLIGEPVRFSTLPTGDASWTRKVAVVSCMGNASDSSTTQIAWADLLDWSPDEVWHLGDWGYWGQLIPPHASYKKDLYHYLRTMRHFSTMRRAIQSADLNVVTISDHELTVGGDPKKGIHNSPAAIRELVAFQKLMPVRTYGDTRVPRRGRYYTYDIGDQVRVIVTDFRSPDRSNSFDYDGPNKTMFGETQLAWLLSSFDSTKLNLLVNETSWLAKPDQKGRAKDKPWFYNYEQKIIADYITRGGYKVAWIGGDRHYVGYLNGTTGVHNTLGGFPCYISSGMSKDSLDLQRDELMTWQFGANMNGRPVVGYMQLTLSYNASTQEMSMSGLGRAVLDTKRPQGRWELGDIPGGVAADTWTL